jgi:hypothetical protein
MTHNIHDLLSQGLEVKELRPRDVTGKGPVGVTEGRQHEDPMRLLLNEQLHQCHDTKIHVASEIKPFALHHTEK